MKWNVIVGSVVLAMSVCTQGFSGGLLDRMLGASGCSSCCDSSCDSCCEPACGAPAACCDQEPACGCPEPACGCEPACGAEPTCCAEPACCDSGCNSCCKKRSCCDDGCCGNGCCGGATTYSGEAGEPVQADGDGVPAMRADRPEIFRLVPSIVDRLPADYRGFERRFVAPSEHLDASQDRIGGERAEATQHMGSFNCLYLMRNATSCDNHGSVFIISQPIGRVTAVLAFKYVTILVQLSAVGRW